MLEIRAIAIGEVNHPHGIRAKASICRTNREIPRDYVEDIMMRLGNAKEANCTWERMKEDPAGLA